MRLARDHRRAAPRRKNPRTPGVRGDASDIEITLLVRGAKIPNDRLLVDGICRRHRRASHNAPCDNDAWRTAEAGRWLELRPSEIIYLNVGRAIHHRPEFSRTALTGGSITGDLKDAERARSRVRARARARLCHRDYELISKTRPLATV